MSDGPEAKAATTSQRFVSDFDPGMRTVLSSGAVPVGAGHKSVTDNSLMAGRLGVMCGRYALKEDPKVIAMDFNVSKAAMNDGLLSTLSANVEPVTHMGSDAIRASFNIAPTHFVPAILNHEDAITMAAFSWGLVPGWAKDPAIGSRMINARVETVTEKPSFRSAIQKRRCIVPANGWYEWEKVGTKKLPHYFSASDDSLLGMAGMFESWTAPDGVVLWSVAILTTEAQPHIEHIHDRMPVLVMSDLREKWLTAGPAPIDEILAGAKQYTRVQEWAVASAVGNVRNNTPALIEPDESTLF